MLATTILALLFAIANVHADQTIGAVYTMTNAVAGNEVVAFDRLADGSLEFSATYATEGLGWRRPGKSRGSRAQ